MPRISLIDLETASEEVKKVVADHVADGYRITNEKLTLLHHVPSFNALELESYKLDRELQKIVGKRAADFYEYAISLQNDCLVCSTYFTKLLKKNGIDDFNTFNFTDEERLLIAYARAIADDPKNVSDELFEQLKARYTEEEIVVITTMGVFMIANNYFNDILQVQSELL
ncbi:MAG: carboxymuconolactone decarboxylase family protein [Acetatifactor sp.]|nr:hypothetical protein [Lachnospiraceae bacterium]MDY5868809.1 hypothetical protein [Lachnospiraceae bacterium]